MDDDEDGRGEIGWQHRDQRMKGNHSSLRGTDRNNSGHSGLPRGIYQMTTFGDAFRCLRQKPPLMASKMELVCVAQDHARRSRTAPGSSSHFLMALRASEFAPVNHQT